MNLMELSNRILELVPNANCTVWQCNKEECMGEGDLIQMGEFIVCWNKNNIVPCPSYEDIKRGA